MGAVERAAITLSDGGFRLLFAPDHKGGAMKNERVAKWSETRQETWVKEE